MGLFMSKFSFLIIFLFVIITATTIAQVPHIISYQGVANKDPRGSGMLDSLWIWVEIYDSETGGEPLWQEEQEVQTKDGVFHILLGTETELDSEIFNQNDELWIQTTIGEEVLSPRIKLTSSPYAFKSEYAEVLGNNDVFLIDTAHTRDPEGLTDTLRNNYWHVESDKALFIKPEVRIKSHLQVGDSSLHFGSGTNVQNAVQNEIWTTSGPLYIQDHNYSPNNEVNHTIFNRRSNANQNTIGKVGIGLVDHTDPSANLDVNGSINTGGESGDGKLSFTTSNSNYVVFRPNQNQSNSVYDLPENAGNYGDVLITGGSPNSTLSWTDPANLGFGGDNDWTEIIGPPDYIRAKEGGIANYTATLNGSNKDTHVNLGFESTSGYGGISNFEEKYLGILSGKDHTCFGEYSNICGGLLNHTAAYASVIAGGKDNAILNTACSYSTVGGGFQNIVYGNRSVIPGGSVLKLYGNGSFAFRGGSPPTNSFYDYNNDNSFAVIDANFHFNPSANTAVNFQLDGLPNTASSYEVLVLEDGTNYVHRINASNFGGGNDNDWDETSNIAGADYIEAKPGGIAVNGATLIGSNANTHINFGYGSTTGSSSGNESYVTIGGGFENNAAGSYSAISGGAENIIEETGIYSSISGGWKNTISGHISNISGGWNNESKAYVVSIGGGINNSASGYAATIPGGGYNIADGNFSVSIGAQNMNDKECAVVIGFKGYVNGVYSGVSSGYGNTVTGEYSGISSGRENTITNNYSGISSGYSNTVSGDYSGIASGEVNEIRGGQYNFIGGGKNNVVYYGVPSYSVICGGASNTSRRYCFVGGGANNDAHGFKSAVVGGDWNNPNGSWSIVGGGSNNDISSSGYGSAIFGGFYNNISQKWSFIGGGYYNNISGTYSAISGGMNNEIESDYSSIAGGESNLIEEFADHNFIGGGYDNIIQTSASYSSISAGYSNTVSDGKYNFIGGGKKNDIMTYSLGYNNYSTIAGGYENRAQRGSFVGGGSSNEAHGDRCAIVSGLNNTCSGYYTIIGGGEHNYIPGAGGSRHSGIFCGSENEIVGDASVISGGYENNIAGSYSCIGGGYQNDIEGHYNNISGGSLNIINSGASYSGVLSGASNTVTDVFSSIAGGAENQANNQGVFIGGGFLNIGNGSSSSILGGMANVVDGNFSVAIGSTNHIDGYSSTAIGNNHYISGQYSGVASGFSNTVTGDCSVITGGARLAIGDRSAAYRGGFDTNPIGPSNTIDLTSSTAPWNNETFYIVDTKFWFNTENHADADFRIDGDDVNLLYADASEDRVGIRNDDPQYEMDVNGAIRTGRSGQDGHLIIYSDQNDQATPAEYEIHFQPADNMVQNTYYTLPENHGHLNDVLVTDGSGVLSWVDACDLCDSSPWNVIGNVMYPGPSDLLIGIGTVSPTHRMHINATDPLRLEGLTLSIDSTDEEVLVVNADGVVYKRDFPDRADNDWTLSGNDMYNNNTGNVGIGTTTPSSLLDVNGDANVAQDMMVGDDLEVMDNAEINGSLFVATTTGIGRTVTDYELEVEGDASKTTAGDWQANSDRRIKTDIKEIDNPYKTVLSLHPVMFRYTPEYLKKHPKIADRFYYNFIAQEYAEVFPESVQIGSEKVPGTNEGIWNMDSYNAQVVSIRAVQELIKENQRQGKEIEELRSEIKELKELVNKMIR